VADEEARELLAEGQLFLSIAGAGIEQVTENRWRLGEQGRGELQVSARGGKTRLAVTVDRRRAKLGLFASSTLAGGIAGSFVLSGVALATLGTIEALAVSNIIGVAVGIILGFFGGRTAWSALAKRSQENVFSAVERMRALAGSLKSSAEPAEPMVE
jgi:cytochrome c biogenesis protein CcdA